MTLFAEGTDLFACAQAVEKGDPERFTATMAAPVTARAVLFPIYAFNLEVARAPWVTKEPVIAQMRLQWWHDALEEIANGGLVRRHEVVTPLAHVLDADGARVLQEVVDAREADIERTPFADADALWAYLEATSGALLWAAARALGEADEGIVRAAGTAAGMANYLRAIPELEAAGKQPLPDGRAEAVAELAAQGLTRLSAARQGRKHVSKDATPAMYALASVGGVLRRAKATPSAVAAGALEPNPMAARLSLMARTATGLW